MSSSFIFSFGPIAVRHRATEGLPEACERPVQLPGDPENVVFGDTGLDRDTRTALTLRAISRGSESVGSKDPGAPPLVGDAWRVDTLMMTSRL